MSEISFQVPFLERLPRRSRISERDIGLEILEGIRETKALQLRRFTAVIEREVDGFVALCPELDIASQGDTVEEAIGVPDNVPLDVVVEKIESCITAVGLNVTLKGTLASYPGSTHWHTKRGKEPGVLEITLWPEKRRLWFSVHRNRSAPWIEESQVRLRQAIEAALQT